MILDVFFQYLTLLWDSCMMLDVILQLERWFYEMSGRKKNEIDKAVWDVWVWRTTPLFNAQHKESTLNKLILPVRLSMCLLPAWTSDTGIIKCGILEVSKGGFSLAYHLTNPPPSLGQKIKWSFRWRCPRNHKVNWVNYPNMRFILHPSQHSKRTSSQGTRNPRA